NRRTARSSHRHHRAKAAADPKHLGERERGVKETPPTDDTTVPLDVERRVDAVCLRFEAAWKAGQRPRIEPYLGDTPSPEHSGLLLELRRLEPALGREPGEPLTADDYLLRFPGHVALVCQVFGKSCCLRRKTPCSEWSRHRPRANRCPRASP